MNFYPPKISEKLRAPQNAGKARGANAAGTGATLVCGTALRFTLRIDADTKEILEAKFKTNACGYALAAADVLAKKIIGKHLSDLHGLDKSLLQNEIESELGEFEIQRRHCLNLCIEALQSAFADFRAWQIEEWSGEKALICSCFGISEEAIEKAILENSLETVQQVTELCRAGGGCGSCQPLIQEILDVAWREEIQ